MSDLEQDLIKFTNLLLEGLAKIEGYLLAIESEDDLYEKLKSVKKWSSRELKPWYTQLIFKLAKKQIKPAQYESMQVTIYSLNQITDMFLQEELGLENCDEFLNWILEAPYLLESNLYLDELPNLEWRKYDTNTQLKISEFEY